MNTPDFDIAICGAGPVGQALALLLSRQGFTAEKIALFDAKTAAQAEQDARSIAISYGSQQILQRAGSWPIKASAIREIHVSRRSHFGRSLMRADDYDVPALGYVARYGDIISPMQNALAQTQVHMLRPFHVGHIEENAEHVVVNLKHTETGSHSSVTTKILVQAEGGTFADQTQRDQRHDYQQTAIIAHVTCDQPQPQRAFERFTDQGPLALLPQEDGYALVWCARPALAEKLIALDDQTFLAELQVAFGHRLGQFQQISKRNAYPLGLNAQPDSTGRTVSIGNAAQTLHPVAGQGLNLGLRDAHTLAKCLSRQTTELTTAIPQFIEQRQTDRQLTIRITDSMARVFASSPDGSFTQSLLGISLGAIDVLKPFKNLLAGQMMYGWR
ncbi:UbiH/UbiF/VisC/COQ6 family ubiquinone biosynthesis hydroxylase [Undibacterium sp. SXout11W]|uniref:UbiH/UbiF/VisC/COQ6 family ubiquinone biosynthesis hydroxylase n=1 Tax=Undibacterium sp. SXout11W TaxID=3413050 RepID=UPI003BF009E9